jgi:hypothetical protein
LVSGGKASNEVEKMVHLKGNGEMEFAYAYDLLFILDDFYPAAFGITCEVSFTSS